VLDGLGVSRVESFSEAGFRWDSDKMKKQIEEGFGVGNLFKTSFAVP
jgi:hypothetical protein